MPKTILFLFEAQKIFFLLLTLSSAFDEKKFAKCFGDAASQQSPEESCSVRNGTHQLAMMVGKLSAAAAEKKMEEVKSVYIDMMVFSTKLTGCPFQNISAQCGKISRSQNAIDLLSKMKCSDDNTLPMCVMGETPEEKRQLTKGFLCAVESKLVNEYIRQCYTKLKDKIDWLNVLMVKEDGGYTVFKPTCSKKNQVINECITFYGIIEMECGKKEADQYYRLTTRKSCGGKEGPPPKHLSFQFTLETSGGFRMSGGVALALSLVLFMW